MSVKDCYWWSSEPQVEPPVEMFLFFWFFLVFLFGFVNDNNTHISCVPKLECTVQVGRF
jgi:hypothetical protein